MAIDRRRFIGLAGAVTGVLRAGAAQAGYGSEPLLASAYKEAAGEGYAVAICDARGRLLRSEALPSRGHACVFRPGGQELIAFARRPGSFMRVLDMQTHKPSLHINSAAGRHFYGHGCFDGQAKLLYCTENAFDRAKGMVGVYDARRSYTRVAEFPSFGIGPHEIVLHPDGDTLIVANGGIETHPDSGREKLNLVDMRSSIAFVDRRNGRLKQRFILPDEYQKLSLRHLAVDADGLVFFGAQHQGAAEELPPLLGCVSMGGEIRLLQTPLAQTTSLKNYISSVCALPASGLFVASSSKGGVAMVCDARRDEIVQVLEEPDVSGVAASGLAMFHSSGDGQIRRLAQGAAGWQQQHAEPHRQLHWDNHLSVSQQLT